MAKRFTDTEKWKKPFIKSMQTVYKLLWLYVLDNCDHAGIWQVEIEIAEMRIGEKIDLQKAITEFENKIIVFDNGEKWFIPSFIEFQYGILREEVKTHKSVINILTKYQLFGYCFHTVKDKDMDMDKFKENEKILTEQSEIWFEDICMKKGYKMNWLKSCLKEFIADQELKGEMDRPINDIKSHFVNYLKIQFTKIPEGEKKTKYPGNFYKDEKPIVRGQEKIGRKI